MKQLLMKLVKGLGVVLSFYYRLTAPFSKLLQRLMVFAKVQSLVQFSIPISTQFDGELQIIGTGKVTWGEHCRFGKDVLLETQGEGVLVIGDNVRVNQGTVIVAHKMVTIGADCLIGEYCSIRDANHKIKLNEVIRMQSHEHDPITIENDCWVGRGAVVLKGVSLGGGCVIGANSLVTKSFSENTVAVGVPAKGIKKRVD